MFFQAPKHHTLYSLSDFERSTRGHGLFGEAEALPDPDPPTEVMSEMVGAEVEAGRVAGAAAAAAETTEPAPLVPAEMMEPPTEVVSEMIWAEAEARRVAGVATSLMGEGRGDELMYSGAGCLSGTG
jgi:hypothetical protein